MIVDHGRRVGRRPEAGHHRMRRLLHTIIEGHQQAAGRIDRADVGMPPKCARIQYCPVIRSSRILRSFGSWPGMIVTQASFPFRRPPRCSPLFVHLHPPAHQAEAFPHAPLYGVEQHSSSYAGLSAGNCVALGSTVGLRKYAVGAKVFHDPLHRPVSNPGTRLPDIALQERQRLLVEFADVLVNGSM
jgi:hypothetical protein